MCDLALVNNLYNIHRKEPGFSIVVHSYEVVGASFPLKIDKLFEMELLIHYNVFAILVDLQLRRNFVVNLCRPVVHSIVFRISSSMNRNGLADNQIDFEVFGFRRIEFEHVLIEMVLVVSALAFQVDVRVEFALPLPKLKVLFMTNLLGFGQFLLGYHLLKLLTLFSLSFLHLLHCFLVCFFCLLLPQLLQL